MKRVQVSDHALIRYMERVYDLDFEKVREEMLPIEVQIAALTCGDGRYPIGDNFIAVIKANTVVTILDQDRERRIAAANLGE